MADFEAKIRDYIADNLDFIEDNLRLIRKEFKLENSFGTRGRVDILAEDKFNNFLIIEVKRSNQSARQAIHEVLKYAGLVQQRLKAKTSEIRVCIISTNWEELLVPFSEFKRNTKYLVEGLKIQLNENMIPIYKEEVRPLDKISARKLSTNHLAFLYEGKSRMEWAIRSLKNELERLGIEDFILIKLHYSKNFGVPIFPFCLYLVIQEYEEEKLRFVISERLSCAGEVKEAEDLLSNPIELRSYLEEIILSKISPSLYDSLESGYPDKFSSITKVQGWEVSELMRYGIFLADPRLQKDEIILSEVSAIKSAGSSQYHNHIASKFSERLLEVKFDSLQCLTNECVGSPWQEQGDFVFSEINEFGAEYELSIEIYNPKCGILNSLIHMTNYSRFGARTEFEFCPNYVIQANFADQKKTSLVAVGCIYWDESKVSLVELLYSSRLDSLYDYCLKSFSGGLFMNEHLICHNLGFSYETDVFVLEAGEIVASKKVVEQDAGFGYTTFIKNPTILDFLGHSRSFLQDLNLEFNRFALVQSPLQ